MKELLKSLWSDESGQGLTEYAVIIALVSIALILLLIAFRNELAGIFRTTTTNLNTHANPVVLTS